MLARMLPSPLPDETRTERRWSAVVLSFDRQKAAKPATDWCERYPCTRMHGAAFEAEFHPAADDSF